MKILTKLFFMFADSLDIDLIECAKNLNVNFNHFTEQL